MTEYKQFTADKYVQKLDLSDFSIMINFFHSKSQMEAVLPYGVAVMVYAVDLKRNPLMALTGVGFEALVGILNGLLHIVEMSQAEDLNTNLLVALNGVYGDSVY